MKFICVFTKKDKNKLLKDGYKYISNEDGLFYFVYDEKICEQYADIDFVIRDTLFF